LDSTGLRERVGTFEDIVQERRYGEVIIPSKRPEPKGAVGDDTRL